MADQVLTKQKLINGDQDLSDLEEVLSGPPGKLIKTRLGREVYTLASVPQINTMAREEVTLALAPKADKVQVTADLSLKADKSTTYTKAETDSLVTPKADKTYVDNAVGAISTDGSKQYATLALANADIANIPLNKNIFVSEVDNGGYWYKATAVATSLTKSPFDPLTQAKSYTDQKTALKVEGVLGKNLFDKSKVTNGKGLNDTGGEITASTRSVSDFIPVSANTAYSFTATTKVCFYDVNKVFVQLSVGDLANVISHANATFMRVDAATALLDTVQVEQGANKTAYEYYGTQIKPSSIGNNNLKEDAVTEINIADLSVFPEAMRDALWLNMHNPDLIQKGFTISTSNGVTLTVNTAYDITEYIPCLPSTQYSSNQNNGTFFYKRDGSFISFSPYSTPFVTPTDCYKMRFQIVAPVSFRFQLNEGASYSLTQQPHKYQFKNFVTTHATNLELRPVLGRKYNLSDAWVAWRNGEKFPVCFVGDSTTNGNGTTSVPARKTAEGGGYDFTEDYVAPNAYPKALQDLIQEATGNTTARIYNAGFSGQRATWAAANMDQIMGYAYADSKMVGISHGINDRTANPKLFADNFYRDIELIIKWCLEHGMQPFLITTQPVTIPDWSLPAPSASGSTIDEVANSIKKNLAEKWGLEIIDVNKFGQMFMQYSTKPLLNNIMESGSNVIHFGDGGHKFTAELMFASFCKRCIWTTEGEQLGYATQLMKSEINHDQLKQINPFKQGFKVELNTTQAEATNRLLQDFYIFNAGRKQLNLTAHYANAVVGQYVEINGIQTTITEQGQNLGSLDLGLHKIKAYSSAATTLDWLGFRLKTNPD